MPSFPTSLPSTIVNLIQSNLLGLPCPISYPCIVELFKKEKRNNNTYLHRKHRSWKVGKPCRNLVDFLPASIELESSYPYSSTRPCVALQVLRGFMGRNNLSRISFPPFPLGQTVKRSARESTGNAFLSRSGSRRVFRRATRRFGGLGLANDKLFYGNKVRP